MKLFVQWKTELMKRKESFEGILMFVIFYRYQDNLKDDIRHNSLNSSYRKKYRKHEKSKLVDDLKGYDLHSKDDKDDRKYKVWHQIFNAK